MTNIHGLKKSKKKMTQQLKVWTARRDEQIESRIRLLEEHKQKCSDKIRLLKSTRKSKTK